MIKEPDHKNVLLHKRSYSSSKPTWASLLVWRTFSRNPRHNSYQNTPEHRYQRKSSGIHLKKCHSSLAVVQCALQCRMKAKVAPRTDLCAFLKTDWKTAQSICGRHNQYHRGSQRWLPSRYIKNTFYAIHSTFRSLGMYMYSKRRYKICTCSVILGQFQPFQNHKGFNIIFPKILDTIKLLQKWEFFWLLSPKWIQKF